MYNNLKAELTRYNISNIEVAKKLGISRSYISRLENKALKEIKEKLKDKDFYID